MIIIGNYKKIIKEYNRDNGGMAITEPLYII